MRRAVWCISVALFAVLLFSVPALAIDGAASDYLEEFYKLFGTDGELADKIGIEAIFSEILSAVSGGGGLLSFSAFTLGAVILIALSSLLTEWRAVRAGVAALAVVGAYGWIFGIVSEAKDALEKMSELFLSLVPIATGVTLAGGGVNSAGAEAVAMGAVFGAVSGIFLPLVLPLVSLMLALSAYAAFGGGELKGLFLRVRSVFMWILGIVTAVLMGGVALQGVICSAKDSVAMRVAKYSASGLLPVIGGTVSASLSSLAAGLSYAKSVIGAQAIYVFLTIALSPLVMILLYRLVLSVGGGLLAFLGADGGGLSYISFSLDALLSVYSVSVILYIFELVMFMKSGVAIL